MSNKPDAKARREEEIAFLAMEQVLGIDIRLADAGAGDKKPDGDWIDSANGRRGIVEVTSPPETTLLTEWARAKREGRPQFESGSMPVRWGELAKVCEEILAEEWARDNIEKLVAEEADERHLFLLAHGERYGDYFNRLSDTYADQSPEPVEDLELPAGIDCVWFRGRAKPTQPDEWELQLARFEAATGWHRRVVIIPELDLPSPAPGIAGDKRLADRRHPKARKLGRASP